MSHRRMGAAASREVLLFVGKARTTSSAPPFSRTSSRNASAGRSSPNGLPPSLTVALAQIGRHPSERPHRYPARVAQIVARLPRRTDQLLVPCAAYTGQRRRPATPLEVTPPAHDGSALNSAWQRDSRHERTAAASRPLSRDRTRCPRCPASRGTTRRRHRQAVVARVPRRARPVVRIRPQVRPGALHPRARCRPARQDAADS
jgi:hypothetical protein